MAAVLKVDIFLVDYIISTQPASMYVANDRVNYQQVVRYAPSTKDKKNHTKIQTLAAYECTEK